MGVLFEMGKTIIFEKRYGVNVENFTSTEEIDEVVEKKIGRKMGMVKLEGQGIVHGRGNVFKMRKYDIEERFEDTIKPLKR